MNEPATHVRIGEARGLAFTPLSQAFAADVERWIATRDVPEGAVLRAGRVWRVGDVLVKLGGKSRFPRDLLRRSPARRAALAHARLAPLRTPRPVLALEWGARPRWRSHGLGWRGHLLVCEFVAGRTLLELWPNDERALAAFPAFMATMHARAILHGDLHPENVLWNGVEWVLLDLDALRGALHAPFRRKLYERQWARIWRNLEFDPRVRALHADATRLAQGLDDVKKSDDAQSAWLRIERRARAMPAVPDELRRARVLSGIER